MEFPDLNVASQTCKPYNGVYDCTPDSFTFQVPSGASYKFLHYNPPAGIGPYFTPANFAKANTGGGTGIGRIFGVYNAVNQMMVSVGSKQYYFSRANSSASFKLNRVADRTNTVLTYVRDANSRLTQITSAFGATVRFNWTGDRVTSVEAPNGALWQYEYNANGMLVKVTPPQPSLGIYAYHYEDAIDNTRLTGYSIDNVRATKYTYAADGKVSKVESMDGDVLDTFVYTAASTTLTDVRGQAMVYGFTTVSGQRLLSSTQTTGTPNCPAAAASQTYDSNGFVKESFDFKGNKSTFSFNSDGMLLSKTVASGTAGAMTVTYTYAAPDASYGAELVREVVSDANGANVSQTDYTYLSSSILGRLPASVTVKDLMFGAPQWQETYTYTFFGNGAVQSKVSKLTLPSGYATAKATYDSASNLLSVTDPAGIQQSFGAYTALGFATTSTDANGLTTTRSFDSRGNVVGSSTPGFGSMSANYAGNGQLSMAMQSTGQSTSLAYSSYGRNTSATNALGETTSFGFTPSSNTRVVQSPRNNPVFDGSSLSAQAAGSISVTVMSDNQLGLPSMISGNNGQSIRYGYDANGNQLTSTDAASRVTTMAYDWRNRMTSVLAADGGRTSYAYDAQSNLAAVTDPRNLVTRYTYDGFGRVLTRVSPDTGTTSYVYDSAGRLSSEARANGVAVAYTWDAASRMTGRTSGGVAETLVYDEGAYGRGHLTTMQGAGGQVSYTYTQGGQLAALNVTALGQSLATGWTWDGQGRLATMTYPGGETLQVQYDSYGRVSALLGNPGSGQRTLADNFLYQPATERLYAWRHGNGLPRMTTLDADGRVTKLQAGAALNLSLGYNTTDTIASISDAVVGSQSSSFGYDSVDRLTQVTRSGGNQSFAIEPGGNRHFFQDGIFALAEQLGDI